MTVAEVREALEDFPDHRRVLVCLEGNLDLGDDTEAYIDAAGELASVFEQQDSNNGSTGEVFVVLQGDRIA